MNCHSIKIVQGVEKGFLGGPYTLNFAINDISICITQCVVRNIELSYKVIGNYGNLYSIFCQIEKLCVLFEGKFLDIKDFCVYDANENVISSAPSCADIKSSRLNYCSTIDICKHSNTKFLDIFTFLDAPKFNSWCELLDELDIIHQAFLYYSSSIGLPVDGKIASLIEIFEPLVELVSLYTNQFSSLKPGEKGTTLKMCLDAIISVYGKDIFRKEYEKNAETFLQLLVNSRNKIMHIKRKFNKICLSGSESVLYILKLSLLYRTVLLSLLGFNYDQYKDNLLNCVNAWENWQDIFRNFIEKKLS